MLNKCGQPTHALDSTQVNSEWTYSADVRRENHALIIGKGSKPTLLHSDNTSVFCRCVHAEYNNSALKTPKPYSGCAELCLLGMIPTLRKGIESQLFTE